MKVFILHTTNPSQLSCSVFLQYARTNEYANVVNVLLKRPKNVVGISTFYWILLVGLFLYALGHRPSCVARVFAVQARK